ncbi:hypothetical protein EMQ25_00635 [Arsenicitalea aurantiaca]|uniref:DUF6460 domain-containing protein n=1 Tax=Arsenicitalea aurantiaca TaxID=1783274 RepID=A0A433XKG2_9HYPH|nr:DUF6460 domain-containing protein [Arsenicitalea aurantiaca]RUT34504.1 hypothetical protein EMQ25_00635 [Arsenicitalea aurantiaca]
MSESELQDYRDRRSRLERFLGDRPLALVVRLTIISLIVGWLMNTFGFGAEEILRWLEDVTRHFSRDGIRLLQQSSTHIIAGAAVVVPIWLLLRVLAAGRRK